MNRWLALLLVSVAALSACGDDAAPTSEQTRLPVVSVPEDAATIGEAVERVAEGGVVLVGPGTYPEQVLITTPDVTLRGTDRNQVVITGEGQRTSGIVAIADGVRIENLTVTDTLLYGVLVTGSHDGNEVLTPAEQGYGEVDTASFPPLERFRIDHVTATNNGLYGIYAFNTRHGVIADSWASGSADSGIYVGQCQECDTLIEGNVAVRNAVGFENANASDSLTVVGNRFSDNRVGLTLSSNYQEAFLPQKANLVGGNVISNNNEPRSPAQADGAFGIGVGIGGGQDNVLVRNRITGNERVGILLDSVEDIPATGNRFEANVAARNGVDLANVASEGVPTTSTCVVGSGVRRWISLPAMLGIGCGDSADGAVDLAELPEIQVPPGISFLDVPRPGELPSLRLGSEAPAPLPATVDHPTPASIRLPDAALLAQGIDP